MARSVSLFAERAGRVLRRPVPRGPKRSDRPAQLMEAIENALVSPPATFPVPCLPGVSSTRGWPCGQDHPRVAY